jgi:monoamine oxidase
LDFWKSTDFFKLFLILGLVQEDNAWNYGNDNSRLRQSYSVVLNHMIHALHVLGGVEIKTNAPVYQIQQQQQHAVQTDSHGGGSGNVEDSGAIISYGNQKNEQTNNMRADRVVITVPPSVLKGPTPLLKCVPPLPIDQQNAINERNFGRAIKVFVLCSSHNGRNFWKNQTNAIHSLSTVANTTNLICCCDPTMAFSQLWYDERPGYNEFVICGFVTSTRADELAKYCCDTKATKMTFTNNSSSAPTSSSRNTIEQMLMAQLDVMFGTRDVPAPCTEVTIKTTSYDWGTHPYVHGGYSSPQFEEKMDDNMDTKMKMRQMYGCLHFAGEATHEGACATTQSAVLSGQRAANEVIRVLQHFNALKT